MHIKSFIRQLRLLTIIFPLIVLAGCFSDGSGPDKVRDAAPPPPQEVEGVLVNTPVSGAQWGPGESDLTTVNGKFPYTEGDTVSLLAIFSWVLLELL